VQKTRKPIAVLARLGRLERLTLSCIQELGLEYQFRIADVVKCLERHYGLPNPGNYLNKRVFDAVNRLVDRGIVVKGDRGIYALRRDLARLSVSGFPLVKKSVREYVVGVENFANTFVRNYVGEVVGKVVEDTVFSPSEDKENLWGRAVVLGGGLTKVQYGGGFGVVRVHVVNPPGDWVGYYVAVSVASRVLSFVSSYVREKLVSLYGVSFVRELDSLVGGVYNHVVSSARVVGGCHGRYNGSPGGFSPLSSDCGVHNYEYGVDLVIPASLARVLDGVVSHVKVYVKGPLPSNSLPITLFLGDGDGRGSIVGV
jgi:hypothetical protein